MYNCFLVSLKKNLSRELYKSFVNIGEITNTILERILKSYLTPSQAATETVHNYLYALVIWFKEHGVVAQ